MGKTIWVVGRMLRISWNLIETRIIELAAVDKMCDHNQDSIEICWIWIQKETNEEKNSRRVSNEKKLYSQCLLVCMLVSESVCRLQSFRALRAKLKINHVYSWFILANARSLYWLLWWRQFKWQICISHHAQSFLIIT